jgi:hypothetical protein
MANDRTPSRIASLLALLGGAVIIAGCLLTWVDAGEGVSVGNVSVTGLARGSDLRLGQAALGAGVASVVLGVSLLIFRRARKVVGLLVLLAGLVAIATAAYVYRSPEDRYADFAADTGAPAGETDEVRASLSNLFEVSNLEANPGVGLYVVIGGGAVSVVAGLAGLFGRRRHAEPEDDLADLGPMVQNGDEDHTAQGGPEGSTEEPTRPNEEPDRTSPQDVKTSVWERSFDDDERTVDRIEDQPAAPTGDAGPEEDHTAGEAEEPPAPQRKDALGDSWAG